MAVVLADEPSLSLFSYFWLNTSEICYLSFGAINLKSTSLGPKQFFRKAMLLPEDRKGTAFLASSSSSWILTFHGLWPHGCNLFTVFFVLTKTLIALYFSIFSPWQGSTTPSMYTVSSGMSTVFTWHLAPCHWVWALEQSWSMSPLPNVPAFKSRR